MSECTHRSAACQQCGKWVGARLTWSRRWKALAKRLWRDQHAGYCITLMRRRIIQQTLRCEGCGLLSLDEPTVRERIDGKVRCADCAAQWEGWRPPEGRGLEWRQWLRDDIPPEG